MYLRKMKYFHTFSSLKCLGQRLDGVNESVKLCHINPPVLWVPQLNVHNKPGRPSPTPPIAPVAVATVASGCSVAGGAGAVSGPGWRVTLSLSRVVFGGRRRWRCSLSLSLSPPSPEATGAESKAATEQEMRARGDEERHFPPSPHLAPSEHSFAPAHLNRS